jgi:hypothetical protein
MLDLDDLLDQAVAEGELEAGVDPALVARRSPGVAVRAGIIATPTAKTPGWSAAEDRFVTRHVGRYTEAEIAAALGRSESAVKIRRYRKLKIGGASRHPELMSGRQMAVALGIDEHSVTKLADRGIIPTWRYSSREMRLTRRVTFLRWAVNPQHWCYFIRSVRDTARLGDAHLRRLIERQKARWADEWMSIGEVADWHGVGHTDVNRYVRAGKLAGVQWGNWWFLRSEATQPGLVFYRGSGSAPVKKWSEAADVFLLIGAGLGVKQKTLAALMKWPFKQVTYRLMILRQGKAAGLIARHRLALEFDAATGKVSGSWADYGHRFPRVRR